MQNPHFSSIKNPTGLHKDWYRSDFAKIFCKVINPNEDYFSNRSFVSAYNKRFKDLEYKDRHKLLVELLTQSLSDVPYKKQLQLLKPLLGKPFPHEEGMFAYGFHLFPVSQFVEERGLEDIKASLAFIYQLTQRLTGEFAIRTIANHDEALTLKTMEKWSRDKSFHVRRLSSEGLRARLPWGKKISWVNESPEKTLPIYDRLKEDDSLYIRRSVANSMGDMIKVNEPLAWKTLNNWVKGKPSPEVMWVVKHAIRTPAKKGEAKYKKLRERLIKNLKSKSN